MLDVAAKTLSAGTLTPTNVENLTWRSVAGGTEIESRVDPSSGDLVFVGYQRNRGGAAFRTYDTANKRARRVGGGTVLTGDVAVNHWVTGNFRGAGSVGGDVALVYTANDRSVQVQFWSRVDLTLLGTAQAFDATFHSSQARGIYAIFAGRQDLLVGAVGQGHRPGVRLLEHTGKLLLDLDVLGSGVE